MTLEVFDMEQHSEAWYEVRRGIPTASEFSSVVADLQMWREKKALWERNLKIVIDADDGKPRKDIAAAVGLTPATVGSIINKGVPSTFPRPRADTSRTYMRKLAGERITGDPAESFTSAAMERGRVMEEKARQFYEMMTGREVKRIGFGKNHEVGASPDGLIGDDGMLEIKTARPDILIGIIEGKKVPPEHNAQIQGQLWVFEREWVDFRAYYTGMPEFPARVYRDDEFIKKTLEPAVKEFLRELDELVARIGS